MAMSEEDRQVLQALATARAGHEELAELLDFYYDLYQVQFEAKARVSPPERRDDLAQRWRLEGGIPQLTFDQMAIEPDLMTDLVGQVLQVLWRHNPGWEQGGESQDGAHLLALARRIYETWDTLTSPGSAAGKENEAWSSDHPLALAVGFGLAPYLQKASETLLPHLDLSLWTHGYCPICGGRPNLALLDEERGARRLMCSRCNSLWSYSRVVCPFCRSRDKQTYYASEDGVYRLYACSICKRYIKTLDLREVHRQVYPAVERLVTVGMDLAAQQEGYQG